MVINTVILQRMLGNAIKGAGFDKSLPITGMVNLRTVDNRFQVNTFDGANYTNVWDEFVLDGELDITVDADILSKLVSKLTGDYVELEVENNILVIECNGTYKIPLPLGDDGAPIKFTEFEELSDDDIVGTLKVGDISTIISTLKPSLSNVVGSCYADYYVGDKYIVATDRAMLSAYKGNFLSGNKISITREFVDLLGLATADVKIHLHDNKIIAESDRLNIYGTRNTDSTDFNVAGADRMMELDYDSFCRVSKSELLSTLERIALFVGDYDDSAITLEFSDTEITVQSMTMNGVECVDYTESMHIIPTIIKIDIARLIRQVKAYGSDIVDIHFGSVPCIKLADGDIYQIIATMKQ